MVRNIKYPEQKKSSSDSIRNSVYTATDYIQESNQPVDVVYTNFFL